MRLRVKHALVSRGANKEARPRLAVRRPTMVEMYGGRKELGLFWNSKRMESITESSPRGAVSAPVSLAISERTGKVSLTHRSFRKSL